ncbi:hypothetical protein PENSUB_12208 [Penicillium subrubescens]|uniref:Uncharacterized protein n=1 Tax=Penicillium subrubescens TaxID=1316194 RepID=A0A1Q5T0Z3_9EURO|nr:hypothetical protein PENSUB_12208 [Penicillium subrubescens]
MSFFLVCLAKSYIVIMSWFLQKIVHNEAMRTDPKEIYGWRVYALACSVSVMV